MERRFKFLIYRVYNNGIRELLFSEEMTRQEAIRYARQISIYNNCCCEIVYRDYNYSAVTLIIR